MQQNYRGSSDDDSSNEHEQTSGEGKSGGNAGAGQSGKEGLGSEKKEDDERFGSQKPERHTDGHDDEGKKDPPGKRGGGDKKD